MWKTGAPQAQTCVKAIGGGAGWRQTLCSSQVKHVILVKKMTGSTTDNAEFGLWRETTEMLRENAGNDGW